MTHIFLVEDDQAIAKNLMLLLQTEGFFVTHAANKSVVSQLLAENEFDLALVDISLPDGNGFAVCTEIKAEQAIPVLFLTASADESSVVTGLNMGQMIISRSLFDRGSCWHVSKMRCEKADRYQQSLKLMGYPSTALAVSSKKMAAKFFCQL